MSQRYDVQGRLALFPDTARLESRNGREALTIGGCSLDELAQQYGTPLYLYDEATLQAAVQAYREALARFYPVPAGLTYAGKAYLCRALAGWMHQQGLWLDCSGAGEIAITAAAGVPRSAILVHGVNKSQEDLQAAVEYAGTIVVDNLHELERLAALSEAPFMGCSSIAISAAAGFHPPAGRVGAAKFPDLWLRLRPGLAVETHDYTQTGQHDSKFGLEAEEFIQAVQFCQQRRLPLTGLHFHQGSQFRDPSPLGSAIDLALDLVQEAQRSTGWLPQHFCPGGGWGVAYHEDDLPQPPIEGYVQFVARRLIEGCASRKMPLPQLQFEPGRSLVARAGVAVYQVNTVKRTDQRRWLLLDGGMADNPRPALYAARYTCLPVSDPGGESAGPAWLAGPYCESGDILIENLPMPEVQHGELLAIPVSGAYHLSMSSNYNGARRPAVAWLREGRAALIQRRETLKDLLSRDLPLDPRIKVDSF